jgi:hypothetical protein
MSGQKYTWANSLANPTYKKMDMILMAMEWEQKFPLPTVVALNRDISDPPSPPFKYWPYHLL